ncbi:MAG: flagellar hook-associated protein FlgL [Clostridia bacterium]|nr:MAG: flagellar hook-associated protein FlgL [Clostridia bacterium]
MRVTQSMISRTVVNNINRNLERMSKAQEQMSTGKVVSRPSDDPTALARIMVLKSTLNQDEQYTKNMEDAIGWLDTSEGALNNATANMQRARELAIYGANGTLSETDMKALAAEVDQLIDEMVAIANTSYAGQYIFAGQQTTAPPFIRTGSAVTYDGNNQELQWEVSPGVTIAPNVTGTAVFNVDSSSQESQLFAALLELKTALEDGNPSDLQAVLTALDGQMDNLLNIRATLGAKSNRLNMAKGRAAEANTKQTELLSRLEDVDMAKISMDYAIQSYVYQAGLATGAKVLQPSLVDYLR